MFFWQTKASQKMKGPNSFKSTLTKKKKQPKAKAREQTINAGNKQAAHGMGNCCQSAVGNVLHFR
jgi:hypothetical protein